MSAEIKLRGSGQGMNDQDNMIAIGGIKTFDATCFWTTEAWFAVHTHIRQEEVAAHTVGTLGVKVLLPRARYKQSRWATRPETVKPLFSGYFFARFAPRTHLHSVRYSRGVHTVLSAGITPVPVEEAIITEIEERLDSSGVAELERSHFEPGQPVTVSSGALEGISGVFERSLDESGRVVVLLNLMEQARVVLESRLLEPAGF
jgi:transcriptional antiterminator RfaH